jgi:hypothetical protein
MDALVTHEHSMLVMDRNGHTTVTWDPRDPASCNDAEREFHRLIREGYHAFHMQVVSENGVVVEEQGTRITEFDPTAGKLMLVPHLQGG